MIYSYYNMNEDFDMSNMSDIDWTDTFADMDFDAEQKFMFIAGLRKTLVIHVRTNEGGQ